MASFNANCSDNASAGGDVTLATLYVTYLKEMAGIVVVVWSYEQFFAAFCQYNDVWLQPPKKMHSCLITWQHVVPHGFTGNSLQPLGPECNLGQVLPKSPPRYPFFWHLITALLFCFLRQTQGGQDGGRPLAWQKGEARYRSLAIQLWEVSYFDVCSHSCFFYPRIGWTFSWHCCEN